MCLQAVLYQIGMGYLYEGVGGELIPEWKTWNKGFKEEKNYSQKILIKYVEWGWGGSPKQ